MDQRFYEKGYNEAKKKGYPPKKVVTVKAEEVEEKPKKKVVRPGSATVAPEIEPQVVQAPKSMIAPTV